MISGSSLQLGRQQGMPQPINELLQTLIDQHRPDRKSNSRSYVDADPNCNMADMGPARVASQCAIPEQSRGLQPEPSIWSILEDHETPMSKSHSPVRHLPKQPLPLVSNGHFPEFIKLKATLNHQFSIETFSNESRRAKKGEPMLVGSSVSLNQKQNKRSVLRRGMESSQALGGLEKVDEVIKLDDEELSREGEALRNKKNHYFKSFI